MARPISGRPPKGRMFLPGQPREPPRAKMKPQMFISVPSLERVCFCKTPRAPPLCPATSPHQIVCLGTSSRADPRPTAGRTLDRPDSGCFLLCTKTREIGYKPGQAWSDEKTRAGGTDRWNRTLCRALSPSENLERLGDPAPPDRSRASDDTRSAGDPSRGSVRRRTRSAGGGFWTGPSWRPAGPCDRGSLYRRLARPTETPPPLRNRRVLDWGSRSSPHLFTLSNNTWLAITGE